MLYRDKGFGPLLILLILTAALPCQGSELTRAQADNLYTGRKYQKAIEAYQQLLVADTDQQGEIHLQIGMSRRYLGKTAQAIPDFDAAIASNQLTPQQAGKARLERGYCLYLSRRFDEALVALQQVMADKNASATSRQEAGMYAGYMLNKLGRPREAIPMFQAAAAEEKTLPSARAAALLVIADTHRTLKEFDEARAMYSHIAQLGGDVGAIGVKAKTRLQELEADLAGDTPFYIAPYLTKLSATQAELFWVSKGSLSETSIEVQDLNPAQNQATSLRTSVKNSALAQEGFFRQHAVLGPLTPWTRYLYSVRADQATRKGTFTTPPLPGVDSGPVRFSVLGDTQTNAIAHEAVAPGIASHQPAFVVHCGDFVENGSRWLEWKSQFFDPGQAYLSQAAFWPTRGNHDGGKHFAPLFGLEEKQFYSFDYGPIHFVILDSFGPHASAKGRAQQAQWLQHDLASTKAKWIFAAVHDPLVNHDYTLPWWGFDDITPIVQAMGVDIVFSGHHHLYRRYLPIQTDHHKPVLHVTTGGAGGSLSGGTVSPMAVVLEEKHHHLNITIDGDTLTMHSVDTKGNVLDQITLTKRDGRYQDDVMAAAVPLNTAHQLASLLQNFIQKHTDNVLPARLETSVQSGKQVTFSIDTQQLVSGKLNLDDFPADTRLVFTQAPKSPWKVATQQVLLSDGVLRFKATAPATLTLQAEGTPTPALEVMLNVRAGERLFVPHRVIVRPTTAP